MTIIRSRVYVKSIRRTGVLLCQDEAALEDGQLYYSSRTVIVPHEQIGFVSVRQELEGSIVIGYTLDQINIADPGDCLMFDSLGIVCNDMGYPVYRYMVYSAESSYQPTGECVHDDNLQELLISKAEKS